MTTYISCPDCGRDLRPQAIVCPECGHRFLGPPAEREPTAAEAWASTYPGPAGHVGRSPWTASRPRPERPELAGVGLVIGLVALGTGFLPLHVPTALPVVLGAVAIALGLLAGGLNSAGIGAILLGAYLVAGPLLSPLLFGSRGPTFVEPVAVPSGFGLHLQHQPGDVGIDHHYLGETVSGTAQGWQVARTLIAAYSAELTRAGWTVEHVPNDPNNTGIIATDPQSHEEIEAYAGLGAPNGVGKPPIVLTFNVSLDCGPGMPGAGCSP